MVKDDNVVFNAEETFIKEVDVTSDTNKVVIIAETPVKIDTNQCNLVEMLADLELDEE